MPEDRENKPDPPVGTAVFATTHWSVVLAAGETNSPQGEAALGKLYRTYFYPLYAFVRRQGHGPHDAEDLMQVSRQDPKVPAQWARNSRTSESYPVIQSAG